MVFENGGATEVIYLICIYVFCCGVNRASPFVTHANSTMVLLPRLYQSLFRQGLSKDQEFLASGSETRRVRFLVLH